MKKIIQVLCLFSLLFCSSGLSGCAPKEKTPLVVFGAGSLIQPFGELEKAFEAKYPQIDVQAEYHGSIQVIRHATDLHEKIDVIATADHALIPWLMYSVDDPDTQKPYANWYVKFATNRLGIAYTPKSKFANEINETNWMDILLKPDVKVGIADPRFDASGYRTLMVYQLAQKVYGLPTLFVDMFMGQFRFPINLDEEDDSAVIKVPEVLETKKDAHIVIRGASVQLLALLESGDLDYSFEYESVIQQHELKMISLPDSLNLGVEDQNPNYGKVSVNLDFQRFATVKPEFKGEQIGYGVTIPSNAPHPQEAALFVEFLLSPEGRKVMETNYHPLFDPALASGYDNMPAGIQKLAVPLP